MTMKSPKLVSSLMGSSLAAITDHREYRDTDPQMLYALWQMELGADPEKSLDEVRGAVVIYDKFAPRVSRRR